MNARTSWWRSLDELADTAEFRQFVENEFPNHSSELLSGPTRRHFLKIMGASFALAGMTGCRRWPEEKVAPFSLRPEGRAPGVPEHFATSAEFSGYGQGLVVTSFDGRPIKIEGNPLHPASRGAATAQIQAGVLRMYDPQRSRHVRLNPGTKNAQVRTWQEFTSFSDTHFAALRHTEGKGLAVLAGTSRSPTGKRLQVALGKAFPAATWCEWEPLDRAAEQAGAELAFGRAVRPLLHLERAKVIATFGGDLFSDHPHGLAYARDWAAGRRSADQQGQAADAQTGMSRVYAAESTYTIFGGIADHRLAVQAGRIPLLLAYLNLAISKPEDEPLAGMALREVSFIQAIAEDLRANRGASVIAAGPEQPPVVHALVHLINQQLGNLGKTVTLLADEPAIQTRSIGELVNGINGGEITTLVILDANPVYTAPADLNFAAALGRSGLTSIHLGEYLDETGGRCTWHLPMAHFLERWGDTQAWDGTLAVTQPLIQPLYDGRSPIELLAMLLGEREQAGYDMVRRTFARLLPAGNFEQAWRKVLHDGLLEHSAAKPVQAAVNEQAVSGAVKELPKLSGEGFEITFVPDRKLWDGRHANNGWLQEAPDPITQLTWDNAAYISVPDARETGVSTGDMLEVTVGGRALQIPAYVLPGQPSGSIALPLGHGRSAAGSVGNNVGADTYRLRSSGRPFVDLGTFRHTGRHVKLACAQDHHAIDAIGFEERRERSANLIREFTLTQYQAHPKAARQVGHSLPLLQLWPEPVEYNGHRWGMAIDLTACIGCNACVVACQAENNIPIVGKEEVLNGREMHWIRLDRYFKGGPDEPSPDVAFQPMTCHHCENAPCESVCPVSATVHDTEGLNTMVYNRCIGTRYCSNNCPYKVRRFNYFDYHRKGPHGERTPWLGMPDTESPQGNDEIRKLGFNPDVTVRMRGVMEKCTYCVQRISAGRIASRNERRPLADGEVVPACAQTCPTKAIIFGDLNDPNSEVRRMQQHDRSYFILDELNTRARTNYLARLRNPSPALAKEPPEPPEDQHQEGPPATRPESDGGHA